MSKLALMQFIDMPKSSLLSELKDAMVVTNAVYWCDCSKRMFQLANVCYAVGLLANLCFLFLFHHFPLFYKFAYLYIVKWKRREKHISTSEWAAKHPFTRQNMQHLSGWNNRVYWFVLIRKYDRKLKKATCGMFRHCLKSFFLFHREC